MTISSNSECELKSKNVVPNNYAAENTYNASAWGVRHSQCILLLFTLIISYSIRACLGVALVAMVHPQSSQNENSLNTRNHQLLVDNSSIVFESNHTDGNLTSGNVNETRSVRDDFEVHGFFNAILLVPPFPRFRWDKKTQDAILSAFFWGYMLLQIPAGFLADKFGPKYLLIGAMSINCLFGLALPIAAFYGGWIGAALCRLIQGLGQACVVPSFHAILGKWSPLEERGRLSGIIYGGQALGTVLGLPITGFIGASAWGWPGIFHFYSLLAGVTAVILWCLLANAPSQHKKISAAERKYIEVALRQAGPKRKLPVPWRHILWSRGMIAITLGHICHSWGHVILYSEIPAYLDGVLKVDLKANGLLMGLPFLCMWFFTVIFSWMTDILVVKKYLNVTQTRKLMNSIGSISAAIGFIALGYAPKNIYLVESLLVFTCAFKIATLFGFHVNHVDIAPNFAGTMMGYTNFFSSMAGSSAPLICGFIITDVTDPYQWRIVFLISAGVCFFTNLVYVVLGTGELAHWNEPPRYEKVALTDHEQDKDSKKNGEQENTEKLLK